jgi:muramoyltetrapeptide carboxypeptidase
MNQLKPLKKGDKVAVISPSGRVNEEKIKLAVQKIEEWGLNVVFGKNTFNIFNKLAGTDKERLSDLQWALDDDEIKAVFCTRGGYGLVRIIDEVNWSKFTAKPKFIIGFSDVTVLHNHVNKHIGIPTIHGLMPNSFESATQESIQSLHDALFNEKYQYDLPLFNNNEIVGGNLAIVYSLLGTNSDIDTDGKVLFLEEISEYAYQIDRMMHALKKAGKLNKLKGLAIGYFTDINNDGFGFSVKEIIENVTKEYNYPVIYDVKAGHENDNRAIVLGRK